MIDAFLHLLQNSARGLLPTKQHWGLWSTPPPNGRRQEGPRSQLLRLVYERNDAHRAGLPLDLAGVIAQVANGTHWPFLMLVL